MGYQHRIATGAARLGGGHLEITGLQPDVAVDGETVTLTADTALGPVPIALKLAVLSGLVTGLIDAGRIMLARQRNRLDLGRDEFEQMTLAAPTVAAAAPTIEEDGDISIIFRFADRPPLALRFPIEMIFDIRSDIDAELGSRSH